MWHSFKEEAQESITILSSLSDEISLTVHAALTYRSEKTLSVCALHAWYRVVVPIGISENERLKNTYLI